MSSWVQQDQAVDRLWWGYVDGDLVGASLARELSRVWRTSEFPTEFLPPADWVTLFKAVGYMRDGQLASPPAETRLTLWRAATHEGRTGLAWTPLERQAKIYARWAIARAPTTKVYAASVSSRSWLAEWRLDSRHGFGEPEVIVDFNAAGE